MAFFQKNLTQNSLKTFAVATLAAAVALASACSSDDPDQGSALSTTPLSGVAIDGYLAGATVYLDISDNGERNAGEPFAITDKDGFFTTAKDGITDYCASDATVAQTRHCLRTTELGAEVVMRAYGGFDLFTGEPFNGSLSTRITVENGEVANKMISPLTSILTDVTDATERQNILEAYGLVESDLDQDFLTDGGFNANRVNTAITFHKIVTILANVFDEEFEAFGTESGFPDSSNGWIYKAIADQVLVLGDLKGLSLVDLSTALTAVYDAVHAETQALYEADEDLSFVSFDGTMAIANAVKIVALVDSAIPSGTLFSDVPSRIIGVEMVVKKIVDGESTAQIDAAIAEAENTSSALYAALDAARDIDFSALTSINYNQAHNFDDIDVSGATPLTALADKQLFITHAQDLDGVSGSAHFFFDSDELVTSGTLDVCLKYDDSNDERVEETEGTLVNGTWFAINNNRLILTLEGSIDITLINKGLDDDGNAKYSLSYGGDALSWISNNSKGLLSSSDSGFELDQPTTNEGCVTLLTPQL